MVAPWIEDLIERAIGALGRADHARALELADQLLAEAPDHPLVRAIRAQALLGSGAGEEALEEAERAVELDPSSVRAHILLGLAAWRTERLTRAQESFQRAVKLSGRKPGVLVDYAWFMASARGPRLAVLAAQDAVDADNGSSTAWAALGLAQFRLRRRQEAEASLKRALQLDPNDPYAQLVMAKLLQDQRQDTKAVALASLLEDTPGTQEDVDSIRREAKKRQIARMLVERHADPESVSHERRPAWWVWVLGAVMIIAGLAVIIPPVTLLSCLPYLAVLSLLLFLLRRATG